MELSGELPVKLLCEKTGIQRSSFYNWKHSVSDPPERKKNLVRNVALFQEYHEKFPSHGYRWLNAKLKLDKGLTFSDPYAHKCCKLAGIKSVSKHYKYKKPGDPFKTYPNLLLAGINIDGPSRPSGVRIKRRRRDKGSLRKRDGMRRGSAFVLSEELIDEDMIR
jgi:hypothetical protein